MIILKAINIGEGVRRLTFVVDENDTQKLRNKEKNILLVGSTGSGKSTMVNALFNHLAGVCYTDKFRYKISYETTAEKEKSCNQARSQTENTTCYTLPKGSGLSTEHTLNIIDTPGFNDTDDKNCRKKIVKQVKLLLKDTIPVLHAICIVMPLASFRLTKAQTQLIEEITSLFANDVSDIIYCLATFNDGGEVHVRKTLHDGKVNIKDFFLFCNAGLFKKHSDDGSSKWSQNFYNCQQFLSEVYKSDGKSMIRTKEVLDAMELLEIQLECLENKVSVATQRAINVQTELQILEKQKEDLIRGEKFEYFVTESTFVKKRISRFKTALNCNICQQTCHKRCWTIRRILNFECVVFEASKCTVCSGKCSPSDHIRESAEYELEHKKLKNIQQQNPAQSIVQCVFPDS